MTAAEAQPTPKPPQAPLRLVAVVVTYNRLPKLQRTIERLCAVDDVALGAIVVVDNASTDGTGVWLSTLTDPRIDVVRSATNSGGAGGFAQGMERALSDHSPDWLVLMDDDGRPYSDAIETFQALQPDARNWAVVAAAVYYPNGDICEMNRPSRNPFWHLSVFIKSLLGFGSRDGFHIGPQAYQMQEPHPIDFTSFLGFFVSAKIARRMPLPNPDLFVYGDDVLYSLAISKSGLDMVFHPDVRFEHECDTFDPKAPQRLSPLWKVYYYHRNLLMLYREAAGWWTVPLLCFILPKWALNGRRYKGCTGTFYRLLGLAIRDGVKSDLSRSHDEVITLSKRNS